MDDTISDKELRRRLSLYYAKAPPVTNFTRKLLLKKLADLESGKSDQNSSKIMPPPKPKTPSNGTNKSVMISSSVSGHKQSQHLIFDIDSPRKSRRQVLDPFDTSDSEVDASSLGRSILPANPYITSSSPKSNETSLMNVSVKASKIDADDQNPYVSSPETKKSTYKQRSKAAATKPYDLIVTKTPTELTTQKPRSSPPAKISSNADMAILRWKEKIMNQSLNENNGLNTSSLNLPSPILTVSSKNSRKNIKFPLLKYPGNYSTKFTQNTILLFVGFFAVIFGLYFISIQSSTTVLPTGVLNSWCAKKSIPKGYKCDEEQEKIQRIFNSVVSLIQEKYIKNQCDKSDIEPTVDAQTVYEYILTHENLDARVVEEIVDLFKSIAKTSSDSPIGFDTLFKINTQPNLPLLCAAKHIFSNMFYLTTWIVIVALCIVGLYFVICYISTKSENYKQELNKLIENTIKLLKEQALNQPNESYLPITHIRDHLIPFDERQSKSKMWAEVVQYFTESESSVRSEVQEIDGEDFQVWKWVAPMSPCVNNVE